VHHALIACRALLSCRAAGLEEAPGAEEYVERRGAGLGEAGLWPASDSVDEQAPVDPVSASGDAPSVPSVAVRLAQLDAELKLSDGAFDTALATCRALMVGAGSTDDDERLASTIMKLSAAVEASHCKCTRLLVGSYVVRAVQAFG